MAAFGEAIGEAVEIGTGVAGVWRRSQRAAEELERGAEVRGDVEREEDEEGGGEEEVELLALRGRSHFHSRKRTVVGGGNKLGFCFRISSEETAGGE